MTTIEKFESAFSPDGTPEIPAVICYENIFARDHYKEITDKPWWYQESPDIDLQIAWLDDFLSVTGLDWYRLPLFYPREERSNIYIESRPEGVFRIDCKTGQGELLEEPRVSGWSVSGQAESPHPLYPADTSEKIDREIPIPDTFDPNAFRKEGKHDLAEAFLKTFGNNVYPYRRVPSPLWQCYNLWGFENMMIMVATQPELVKYACSRFLELSLRAVHEAAALGSKAVFIEECLTDMVSPADFKSLNLPFLRRLVDEIRLLGKKSIYYYCGNPSGKWKLLIDAGADALALEEGKKGFANNIEEIVQIVNGRCTVLGNLDAIGILQNGSEDELRAEIRRQIKAGRNNKSRFIMSIGSPVTPETPVERVRLYCDLVHEMGC